MREHIYVGERCIYCGVNTYDSDIYGPVECDREPITYTTESKQVQSMSTAVERAEALLETAKSLGDINVLTIDVKTLEELLELIPDKNGE